MRKLIDGTTAIIEEPIGWPYDSFIRAAVILCANWSFYQNNVGSDPDCKFAEHIKDKLKEFDQEMEAEDFDLDDGKGIMVMDIEPQRLVDMKDCLIDDVFRGLIE